MRQLPYTAGGFTLSFPQGFEQDNGASWDNMIRSLTPQVQLFWDQATLDVLKDLAAVKRTVKRDGVNVQEPLRVILRLDAQQSDQMLAQDIQGMYRQKAAMFGGNPPVIIRNEQDPKDLTWAATDWGIDDTPAWFFRFKAKALTSILDGAGAPVILGALSMHGYTEDDAPDPGLFVWREKYTSPMAMSVMGYGVHYYDGGWWVHDPEPKPQKAYSQIERHGETNFIVTGYYEDELEAYINNLLGARLATQTNVQRFMQMVRFWSGFYHLPIYWDETNTNNGSMSQVEHMEACVGKSKLLIHHVNPTGVQLGARVAMLSPFASNGLANAYPAQYIMTDPACYEVVRQHMIEEGYQP